MKIFILLALGAGLALAVEHWRFVMESIGTVITRFQRK